MAFSLHPWMGGVFACLPYSPQSSTRQNTFCQTHVMMRSCYGFVLFMFILCAMPSVGPSSVKRLFYD